MCNIIENLIIGFVSGALSSVSVTAVWSHFEKKKIIKITETEQKRQYILDFADNIQLLCKYIDRLQLELSFEENNDKTHNILRLIEDHPATPAFKNGMNAEGTKYLLELKNIETDIKKDTEKNLLNFSKSENYRRRLFQLECIILRDQALIRNTWEEAKGKM